MVAQIKSIEETIFSYKLLSSDSLCVLKFLITGRNYTKFNFYMLVYAVIYDFVNCYVDGNHTWVAQPFDPMLNPCEGKRRRG